MEKTCGNCFSWKQKKDENSLGHCLSATKGKREVSLVPLGAITTGFCIRPIDGLPMPKCEALFHKDFGCIKFTENV